VRGVSAKIDAAELLRPGLLDGVHVVVCGAAPLAGGADTAATGRSARLADAVASTSAELGAHVSGWRPGDAVAADVDQLVIDAAGLFAAAGEAEPGQSGARASLSACLDGAWEATRTVVNAAFIDAGRAGRVVYLAPASAADGSQRTAHADAARAGLENLARTLSIEWARYGVTLVTIAPGESTSSGEVAAVAAFLGSPAGAYYSGCLFDLGGLAAAPPGAGF
jgi:NAD(P)-dependent dehydrogenase (short-subunit alcohol dehydrogenase family)